MDTILQDIRYGLSSMLKQPGFVAMTAAILALGIGASTTIFSAVDAVLIKPLPYDDPSRIVLLWGNDVQQGRSRLNISMPDFLDYREENQVFEDVASYAFNLYNITGGQDPEQVRGAVASTNFFDVLGARTAVGRTFAGEDETDRVVVLSNSLWRRYFAGAENVVGQSLMLNDEKFMVIGVMPPEFQFPPTPDRAGLAELWVPLNVRVSPPNPAARRGFRAFRIIARLKPGMTMENAEADVVRISQDLEKRYPDSNEAFRASLASLNEEVVKGVRPVLLVLFAAVGFVLLIACGNVANLLLVRMASREKEIAIRAALGAGKLRLVRQLLAESIFISLIGGIVGLLLAKWGIAVLKPLNGGSIPRLETAEMDLRLLAFNATVSLLTGLVAGIAPSIRALKVSLSESLKEGGRGSSAGGWGGRIRNALVGFEVALALVVAIGAGLMTKSFFQLINVDTGFDPQNVLTMRINLPPTKYGKPELQTAFYQQVLEKMRSMPGIKSAGACISLPPTVSQRRGPFAIDGKTDADSSQSQTAQILAVTPGYFETLRVKLLEGRFFTDEDGRSAPVVIMNQNLANHYFPGESPIGKRIKVGSVQPDAPWHTVVGLVGDVKYSGLEADTDMQLYSPFVQSPFPGMFVVVRTDSDPQRAISSVRNSVAQVDRNQPLANVRPMDEVFSEATAQHRMNTLLMFLFAVVAVVLAIAGIYGVMSYSVNQRKREIGVRMALGARPADVLQLVIGQGLRMTVAGVLVGLVGAFLLTRMMINLLFKVSTTDAITYAAVSLVLVTVAMIACYIPARSATRVDPSISLRNE